MNTVLYETSEEDLQRAAEVIKSGGLVAFPTETVYGLGADAFSPGAARAAYGAKGRPSDNPLIVHIADTEGLYGVASAVPPAALKLAEAFWPGPLTMVLPKVPGLPKETTGGLDTVAVRLPASEATRTLIRLAGTPLSGPSANLSGHPSPTCWQHVRDDLDGRIDGIIKGKPCEVGIESTVLDLTDPEHPVILRPGFITPEMIAAVTKTEVSYDPALTKRPAAVTGSSAAGQGSASAPGNSAADIKASLLESADPAFRPKAPGMKYRHYAPKAEMILIEGNPQEVAKDIARRRKQAESEGKRVGVIENPDAANFFAYLRDFDAKGTDLILAPALPESDSLNFSVMNRMLKAAGYHTERAQKMKIAIASDHGGFELKEALKPHLTEKGYEVEDLGIHVKESVDYPIYGKKCAEYVASGSADLGIVCCGTGIGIGIAANKIHGIRCAELVTPFMAEMAKKHNHANMVSLGGRVLTAEQAIELVDIWLDSEEEHDRHDRRVALLDEM